jgi:hypothetical protein
VDEGRLHGSALQSAITSTRFSEVTSSQDTANLYSFLFPFEYYTATGYESSL